MNRIFIIILIFLINFSFSQDSDGRCNLSYFRQSNLPEKLLNFNKDWFGSEAAGNVSDNILLYQRVSGGWPKNINYFKSVNDQLRQELIKYKDKPRATIDNGATHTQLQFLARVIHFDPKEKYIESFLTGLEYLLEAQYDNGGWGQYYPPREGYYKHITYNDDAMTGVLRLLSAVAGNEFDFVPEEKRVKAQEAVNKGIDCILKTQIVVDGKLTAWCAQHDENTLKPAPARKYELISISGKETAGILQFLMEIKDPSPDVIRSVASAVSWLEDVKLYGIKVIRKNDPSSATGRNKVAVNDENAPPIWARFYEIGTNKPFFSDRDGKMYDELADISYERRNEYGWLGYWPKEIIDCYHSYWKHQF